MTRTANRRTSTPSAPDTPPDTPPPLQRGLLDSRGACDEPNCMSGYAGVHADRCRHSTAKRCILCLGPYHGDGLTCIRCNREIRSLIA